MSLCTLGPVRFCSVTMDVWFHGVATCHCGLLFPIATSMEQRLPSDTAGPQGMPEIILMEWTLMEPSVHPFTAGPHGMLETIVL